MELLLDVARAVNLSACEEISRVPLSLSLSLSSKFSQAYRNFGAWVWAATWQNSRHGDAQVHLNEKFFSLHFVGGLIDAIHCSTFAKLEGEGVIHGWSFDHPSFTRNGHLHYRLHAKWWMRARILKRETWNAVSDIRNQEFLDPLSIDRSEESFSKERSMMFLRRRAVVFLRVTWLLSLSLSLSLCLCIMSRLSGVRVIYRPELR